MRTTVRTGGLQGIDGVSVQVEVDLVRGLPAFHLVGLPTTAVRESRDRIRAAPGNTRFTYPMRRITVNLAPAGIRKVGASYDVAIAMSTTTV